MSRQSILTLDPRAVSTLADHRCGVARCMPAALAAPRPAHKLLQQFAKELPRRIASVPSQLLELRRATQAETPEDGVGSLRCRWRG